MNLQRTFPNSGPESGQALVEYAMLVFFCVMLFGFQANMLLGVLDDYAQGFYFILQQPFP